MPAVLIAGSLGQGWDTLGYRVYPIGDENQTVEYREAHAAELVDWQCDEQLDTRFQLPMRIAECAASLFIGAVNGSRIGHTPMRGDRIAGPDRADLTCGLIADGEYEVHDRRTRPGELIPTLAAQIGGRQSKAFQQIERERMHRAAWETPGAKTAESALAPMLDQHFGQYAPGRVARAEKEDVIDLVGHPGLRASTFAEIT